VANRVSLASNIGAPRLIPINDYAQGAVAARRVTRDEVRREMLDASSNAWRSDPTPSGVSSQPAAGPRVGDVCMIDNEPGTMQMVNGQLTCVAHRRSDAAVSITDARRLRDEAWREMCDAQRNAWRGK
jgi:hypothetical protein